jgi:small subunit ribosomal protein S17e
VDAGATLIYLEGSEPVLTRSRFITVRGAMPGGVIMGRVRPTYIKRLARDLVETEEGRFSDDFDHNKNVLKEMDQFESRKVRNRVAGYIVRVLENKKY